MRNRYPKRVNLKSGRSIELRPLNGVANGDRYQLVHFLSKLPREHTEFLEEDVREPEAAHRHIAQRCQERVWSLLAIDEDGRVVGDATLDLYQEAHSMRWPETRPLTQSIWETARRLGVAEFIPRTRHEIRDDHLPLRNIAKIPTCDIIDFDYPAPGARSYWHTTADTPDKCSALSLAKVGGVVLEWLRTLE